MSEVLTLEKPRVEQKTVSCDCERCNERAIGLFETKQSGAQNLCLMHTMRALDNESLPALAIYDQRKYDLALIPPEDRCMK